MAAMEKSKTRAHRPPGIAERAHSSPHAQPSVVAARAPATALKESPASATPAERARSSSAMQQTVGNVRTETLLHSRRAEAPLKFPAASSTQGTTAAAPGAKIATVVPMPKPAAGTASGVKPSHAAKAVGESAVHSAPSHGATPHGAPAHADFKVPEAAAGTMKGHAAPAAHGKHATHGKTEKASAESKPEVTEKHGKHAAHGKHRHEKKTEGKGHAAPAESAEGPTAHTAGPAAGGPIKLHMPEPPSTLSHAAEKRIQHVKHAAGHAAAAHAALPSAEKHVSDARGAVDEPKQEADAHAQANLVAALDEKPAPSPEIEELCKKIYRVIKEKRPPDEDSLVDAKPEEMARESGTQVGQDVQGDTNKVQGSYSEIKQDPKGGAPAKGQTLETSPEAVATPPIGAEQATPDAVPASDVSLKQDVDENRQRMDQAGMTSEPAQLVKSGPIAEARQGQQDLEKTAEEGPAQALAAQKEALGHAQSDMNALQQAALDALSTSRTHTVKGTSGRQHKMVGSEEEMRTQASTEAQNIFTETQTKVENLLRPLPEKAMQKWDAGKEIASQTFKRELSEVDRRIKERHAGVGGFFTGVWDAATGLPSWVVERYDKAEQIFGDDMCRLAREISTEVNGVIAACEALIKDARQRISEIFSKLPKGLQEWAAQEQAKLGSQLDGLQKHATDTRNNFNRDLIKRASEAVQEVREQIADLRKKAGGILGRIVDAFERFIKDPVKFIIEGLLELVGIPPAAFWALVAKIQKVIADIAHDPLGFAKNLLAAIGQGFQQFFDHILTHLLKGFVNWLTGGLADAGVTLPKDGSIKSIITFFLQLMGITWPRIRKLLVKHIGEKNVALIEKVYSMLSTLIELGPEGIFEMIKEKLDPAEILNQVINAAVNYLIEALIKQVTARIILLFNPVGAIFQALEAIYRVLKWIFVNAARIFHLVETVVNGIADIIAGNIGGMANAIESALAQLIPPVIDFLADYLGLGGLPAKIKETIIGFQNWIEGLLDKAIGWLVEKGKALLAKLGIGKKEDDKKKDGADGQVGKEVDWTVGEESHRLWIATNGTSAEAMMASKTMSVAKELDTYKTMAAKLDAEKKSKVLANITQAEVELKKLESKATDTVKDVKKPEPDKSKAKSEENEVENEETALVSILKAIQQDLGISDDFGSYNNPIPLNWLKHRLVNYPIIYVGPLSIGKPIRQEDLEVAMSEPGLGPKKTAIKATLTPEDAAEWADRHYEIGAYRPNEPGKALPDGSEVGVAQENWVDVGFTITMREPGTTGGGSKITNRFKRFGMRARGQGREVDGDHVVERQLGGEDAISNLWPLDKDENQKSGRELSTMKFKDEKAKDPKPEHKMADLKDKARGGVPVVFKIVSTLG